MNARRALPSLFLVAVACSSRSPLAPPEHSKIAVVEFSLAPDAKVENFGGDPASIGLLLAQAASEVISAEDTLDAQAISKDTVPEGDYIVRGEITRVWGGSTA